ncbi:MAG: glycosyltransferase family 2 protein [Candidatus Omnitrophica bacterium]|nr:glycosyltransferase family 2 protein [Candidatus Omnitrophota bacterium]
MKLSVIVPIFNEVATVEKVLRRVLAQPVPGVTGFEVVAVDDGSQDGTADILNRLESELAGQIVLIRHDRNLGKGAAVRSAAARMTGDICIIQDADLEYDPSDYPLMLEPIIQGRADCVFGSRFTGTQAKRVLYFWHYVANRVLTVVSDIFTNLNLTDMETGFKAFRVDVLKNIPIRSCRFGFEPEITAKVARRRLRVYEVGISYSGRTYAEGKKITWVDGVKALVTIARYSFRD